MDDITLTCSDGVTWDLLPVPVTECSGEVTVAWQRDSFANMPSAGIWERDAD